MRTFLAELIAIFRKDMLSEFRSRQGLAGMIVLGLLIVWIFRISAEAIPAGLAAAGAAGLWVALVFAGMLIHERLFASEKNQGCIYALLVSPADAGTIYLAKLMASFCMLSLLEFVTAAVTAAVFRVDVSGNTAEYMLVLVLGNIAVSSVGIIFSAMIQLSSTRGSVLGIIVLSVLLPVMIPAVFALLVVFKAVPQELAGTGALAFAGTFNKAVGYMAVFDAVFVTAGWLLFDTAVRE